MAILYCLFRLSLAPYSSQKQSYFDFKVAWSIAPNCIMFKILPKPNFVSNWSLEVSQVSNPGVEVFLTAMFADPLLILYMSWNWMVSSLHQHPHCTLTVLYQHPHCTSTLTAPAPSLHQHPYCARTLTAPAPSLHSHCTTTLTAPAP